MEWVIYNKITDKLFVVHTENRYEDGTNKYTVYYGSSKVVLTFTQFAKQIACNPDIEYLCEI